MNDKTKLVKEAKNDKASRCWFAYQKRLGKMRLGEMRLGEMLPNHFCYLVKDACIPIILLYRVPRKVLIVLANSFNFC